MTEVRIEPNRPDLDTADRAAAVEARQRRDLRGTFAAMFRYMASEAHDASRKRGFWDNDRALLDPYDHEALMVAAAELETEEGGRARDEHAQRIRALADRLEELDAEFRYAQMAKRLMLMVSEIAEAMEALRQDNPPDDKIPDYSGIEAELADTVIRVLDFAGAHKLDVAGAVLDKMAHNETRERKHGKAF